MVAWWGKALLHIPPHFTWPFSKLLAFPHASNYLEVGAVTVLPWVAMCDRFSNLLARVVFPERVRAVALVFQEAHAPPLLACGIWLKQGCCLLSAAAAMANSGLMPFAVLCRLFHLQMLDLRTTPLSPVLEEPELQQQ